MDTTSAVRSDGDLETHLIISDGARAWEPDDLAAVITATAADPAWLQLQAAINKARGQEK